MRARRMRKHKQCRNQRATNTATDTAKWYKNKPPKLEEMCLGPESRIFDIPGQLHAQINSPESTPSPPTMDRDICIGLSHDDPLFDEATNILSNRFPSRGVATIRRFIEDAYKAICTEVEAASESTSSLGELGTCSSILSNTKGVEQVQGSVDRSTSSAPAKQVCRGAGIACSMKNSTTINSLHGM
jgi:hypothetical protein